MRAAIVGSGGIARIHARLIRELGGEVAAVCGRTLDGARTLGVGTPFDDLAAMVTTVRPDVVHVCTPNHLHAEQTIAAFATGAHVLCEKPLATNSGDGRGGYRGWAGRGRRLLLPGLSVAARPAPRCCHRPVRAAATHWRRLPVAGCVRCRQVPVALQPRHGWVLLRADGLRRALARPGRVRHRPTDRRGDGAALHPSGSAGMAWRRGAGPAASG